MLGDYPFLVDFGVYKVPGNPEAAVESFKKECDAFAELLTRPNYQESLKNVGWDILANFEAPTPIALNEVINDLCPEEIPENAKDPYNNGAGPFFTEEGWYIYPLVSPTDNVYKAATEKVVIEETILKQMTEEQLVHAIADYPLILRACLGGTTPEECITSFAQSKYSSALKELMTRPDYQKALKEYGTVIAEQRKDEISGKILKKIIEVLCGE